MIAASPVNHEPTWQQVERGTHRWELRHAGDAVRATVWLEQGYWHWSVPGNGIPKRGMRKVFREATVEAEGEAAKKGKRA